MRVSILTLGCKVNQAEMSDVESSLRGQGHDVVALGENPDICVINTCTVTSKSDYQSRQLIRRAGRTGARVLVTGCYSELKADEVRQMDGVDEVIPNVNKTQLIKMIDQKASTILSSIRSGRTRYFLKVQDGCNNSCSYCIVHVARGASRSVSPESIIEKINTAVAEGFREVVLTGIHLGQYGCDLPGDMDVTALVTEVLDKTAIDRLRLSSLEVTEIDDRLLELFANPRLMPHLHVPLQSGDDGVLKMMDRGYDSSKYKEIVDKIQSRLPGSALGTDVIAGFPQESAEAFDNTVRFIKGLPFTYMHVFPYSRRQGTPAALMKDIAGDHERERRAVVLRELAGTKRSEYMKLQSGRTLDVLFEERVQEGLYRGTSCNYLKVSAYSGADIRGTVAPVSVEGYSGGRLIGVLAKSGQLIDNE